MAQTKRVLSILLALSLGMALLVPAFATDEPDPNAPVITKQPMTRKIVIREGKDIKLEVEARLPDGVEGMLSYAWYDYNWQLGDTTEPVAIGAKTTLRAVPPEDEESHFPYCVVVTNTYRDSGGNEKTASKKSDSMDVFVMFSWSRTTREKLASVYSENGLAMTIVSVLGMIAGFIFSWPVMLADWVMTLIYRQ